MQVNNIIKRLRIKNIIYETHDARTFVLEPLDGWHPAYQAGQFVTIVFNTKHGEKRRSYSISSSPLLNEPLSITIKKIDNGEFSRLLIYKSEVGDILLCSGISGFFLLPGNINSLQQYFFLAAGSGITPCFGMIKTVLAKAESNVVLIYSNRTEADTIFYSKLIEMQELFPERFIIHFLFSNLNDVYRSRLGNWLLKQLLDKYLEDSIQAKFYVCGPFDYMHMVSLGLAGLVPEENIHKENFSNLPRLFIPRPPDTHEHSVTIRINQQEYNIAVQYPMTILAAAKAKNIQLPYSCEAGRCGSCAATCSKGKVWMAYNEVLTDDEVEAGRALICQSYPVGGDAVIEF
ncbi:MAG: iron-sulfur cluster-binding domain-containing protein [Ferruginibacter sp.]